MKRFLFTVIPEKGHIHPYIAPAARLRDAGHRVAFHAVHDISEQLERAGFDLFLGPKDRGPPPDVNRGAEFARRIRDREWLREWIKKLLVDLVPGQVEPLRAVVKEFQPDVIVTDPMVYQAAIVAQTEGIPWAAVSNSLNPILPDSMESELLDTTRWLTPARRELFARYGLEADFRGCDLLSPHLTVAFTTRELSGRDVPGVHQVGPSIPLGERGDECPFPWDRLRKDVPVVYMSLGSQIYYQPRMFRKAIEAVRGKAAQLVLTVSELLGSDVLGPLPENVLAVRYTPQVKLLARVRAMITHGGANSVMEALTCGVPLLISPICNDQFHQARFIEASGVGVELDLETAPPERCWEALEALLAPGPYRENTARVSKAYRRDGGAEAARLIEELAGRSLAEQDGHPC